jgi:hypothetical protein
LPAVDRSDELLGTARPPTSMTTATRSVALPGNELPSRGGDYRERRAGEQVHNAAADALDMHPNDRPSSARPPQLHRDIGLDVGP